MNAEDIQKMIADAVSKATAERAKESQEKAKEEAAKGELKALVEPPRARKVNGALFDPLQGKGADFARHVLVQAIAQKQGATPLAIAKQLGFDVVVKDLAESSYADGGSLVHEQVASEFIELLRSATVCLAMGARTVPFKGSISFGRQTGAASAAWVGESSNISKSSPTTGELKMAAKKLAGLVVISNDLLRNPSAGIEAFVRDDLVRVIALALDKALLEGSGSAYQPKGLDLAVNSSNQFAITGTALANVTNDLTKMIRLVEQSDVPMDKCGFVMHPRTKWALAALLDSNGNRIFFDELMAGRLLGFPVMTKSGLTISGSNYKVYFGQWSELILGVDTPLEAVTVENAAYHDGSVVQSGLSRDESAVRALGRYDAMLRHDMSFSILTGVSY